MAKVPRNGFGMVLVDGSVLTLGPLKGYSLEIEKPDGFVTRVELSQTNAEDLFEALEYRLRPVDLDAEKES